MSNVKTQVNKTFKKIRIKPRKIKPSPADRLIGFRNKLLKQGKSKESRKLDVTIAKTISEEGQKRQSCLESTATEIKVVYCQKCGI